MSFPGSFAPTLYAGAAGGSSPTSWEITVVTTISNQDMTVQAAGNTLDYVWGDGNSDLGDTTASITHTYVVAGTYTLQISGTATRIWLNNLDAAAAVTAIGKIWGITGLTSAFNMFEALDEVTEIPTGIFDEFTGILTFEDCFKAMDGLVTVASGIFDTNVSATSFEDVFYSSTMTSIPTDIFRYNTAATTFKGAFRFTDITSIPTDIFRYNTLVTDFYDCFGSGDLTSVPTDIFRYNTAATTFTGVLAGNNFTSPPTDIFRYNTAAIYFSSAFKSMTTLTSLPADLFRYNTSAVHFIETFSGCTNITALPVNLLDYVTATDISGICSGCTSLTTSNADTWVISGLSGAFNLDNAFLSVTLDTSDYDALLIAWEGKTHNNGVTFHAGNSIYTSGGAAETARTTLDVTDTWTITDGGGT